MNVKVRLVSSYGGHSLSTNGSVNLTLKASYSELSNSVKLMQLLNNDIDIKAKLPGMSPVKLGSFRIKMIRVDDDGESVIKFNGLIDYVEADNLTTLVTDEEFVVMFEADVEEEDENEEE